MSKWTKANEYVPVTKGSTAVITLQSDGDIYGHTGDGDADVLLASASAGITKVPMGSFGKITCTAPFILTTESAISRLRRDSSSGGGTKTPPYIEIDGEKIVIVGDKNSTASPRNLAGFVPNFSFIKVEGVVDISYLAFQAKNITTQENIDIDRSVITSADYAFSESGITSASYDWPSLIQAEYMYRLAENLESITGSTFPSVQSGYAMFARTYKLNGVGGLEMPKLKIAVYMFQYSGIKYVERCYFGCTDAKYMFEHATKLQRLKETYFPNLTNAALIFNDCPSLSEIDVHYPKLATLNFTSTSGPGGLGNVPTLYLVTVLDGGLAACTSFNISASTNITDASIQNIIDALPDYSGTQASALVSFPPDRLTEEQQTQLTNKGWTYDEATTIATLDMTTYWFFTNDNSGDFVDSSGKRYIAHSGSTFHTPHGLNVGCPEAETAEEAGAAMGLTYDPLPREEEQQQAIE